MMGTVLRSLFWLMLALSPLEAGRYQPQREALKEAVRFQEELGQELLRRKKLCLLSFGQEVIEGQIESLTLRLKSHLCLEPHEARCFYIHLLTAYLEEINRSLRLRPFLSPFPFTAAEVSIELIFETKEGAPLDPRYISLIFVDHGGNLIFAVFDPLSHRLRELFVEELQLAFSEVHHRHCCGGSGLFWELAPHTSR